MEKRRTVPLEEALDITGSGLYTYFIVILAGIIDLVAFAGIQLNSMVIPAAGCDLHLTTYQKGALTSMVYTGMLFSSHMWGFLADAYGRRTVMLACSFCEIFVTLAMSLVPSAPLFMLFSFFSGLMLSGIFTPIYVYIGECCPQHLRAKTLVLVCAVSALANFYLPSMALLLIPIDLHLEVPYIGVTFNSWRLFVAHMAVPFTLSTVFLYVMPETPKFLLNKGRQEETMRILIRMYTANNSGKRSQDFPVESVVIDQSDEMVEKDVSKSHPFVAFFKTIVSQTTMIFTFPYLKYALLSCILCVGLVGVFNTVVLWFPEVVNRLTTRDSTGVVSTVQICDVMSVASEESDDVSCTVKDEVFIISCLNGALQVVVFCLFSLVASRFKKKTILVCCSTFTTFACAAVIVANKMYVIIAALVCVILGLIVIFPIFIAAVVEFFPTSLRTNAMSLVMLCGRIAAVCGSQLMGLLYVSACSYAYPFLSALLLCMTALFFALPVKT